MAVLIPGKLVYLATPHTASIATTHALATIPNAQSTRLGGLEHIPHLKVTHHGSRSDVGSFTLGDEIFVTTVRNPCDLVVTWWLRQQGPIERHLGAGATFEMFVDNIDKVMGPLGSYLEDGKLFWHVCDQVLVYETLAEDLNTLLTQLDLPTVKLEIKNVTENKKPWQQYYSKRLLRVVKDRFKQEMELYGYNTLE